MRRIKATGTADGQRQEGTRLPRADRRDALIDAATELVATGDVEAISVESVAERAGVSRPLVYKHFANRDELLAAVYQREAALLQRELADAVEGAKTLEEKLRALIRSSLRAEGERGATFAALRSAGLSNGTVRERQRRRDRANVDYFSALAIEEIGLDERLAREAVGVLLGAIQATLSQWRFRPTAERAHLLENVYVGLAMGGLAELARP